MMDLRSELPEQLQAHLSEWGEPKFRAKQLFAWLQQGAQPEDMQNLPKTLRERLASELPQPVQLAQRAFSSLDGTQKLLFRLHDGELVEGVLMEYQHGVTLCLSTQVGCAMGCLFCASTLQGKLRDLAASEMLGQIHVANGLLGQDGKKVGNVVLMGSGEPLENYHETVRFLRLVHHPDGLGIGLRHVSLSTCGLVPQMRAFAEEGLPVTLSVSLHAPDDIIRRQIMPVAKAYGVEEIIEACRLYIRNTGRRIIFEYALIEGVNSEPGHARALSQLLRGMQCHVNVIPLNPVPERNLVGVQPQTVRAFLKVLEEQHISATKRREMGTDIEGACGQLRRRHLSDCGGK